MVNQINQQVIPSNIYVNVQGNLPHFHQGYWTPDIDLEDMELAQKRYVEELTNLIPIKKGDTILEIGCGTGETAIWLAQKFECTVYGIDIIEANIFKAREAVQNQNIEHLVHVLQMDALDMNFPANFFDHVLGIEAIYHIKAKKDLFAKLKNVVKPGGHLVFSDYTLEKPHSWLLYELASEILESKHIISLEEYSKILKDSGFKEINNTDISRESIIKTFECEKAQKYRNVKEYVRETYGIFSYLLVSLLAPVISYIMVQGVKKHQLTLQFISCINDS